MLSFIRSLIARVFSSKSVACAQCGTLHKRRNECDNTFSAFCSFECHDLACDDAPRNRDIIFETE